MQETNLNLQEILYLKEYRLIDVINDYNKKYVSTSNNIEEFINDNITISPSFKRALIQSYTIIEEIERIFHRKIDEYYIECTRTNQAEKNKKAKSRYEIVKEFYNDCKNIPFDNVNFKELNQELDNYKDALRSDLLFLYFMQLGKCMYSLEPINIDDLTNNAKYDIDHIYPQSIIKDDSISNRVLVKSSLNREKTDTFLFETNVLNKQAPAFYAKLFKANLISKTKYHRLTQKELTQGELDGFVNRQIVSTNQAVKGLITVLKLYHNVDDKNIIYSKAENVSIFRQMFKLVKSRLANNFHHAHDAYLNIIVGGLLNQYYSYHRFSTFKDLERLKNENRTMNPSNIFAKNSILLNGKNIWEKDKMISRIKHDLYNRFDVNETIRTFNPNEMYSKTTILPAGSDSTVPVKTTDARIDAKKYGGITSHSFSKYVLIKTTKKSKTVTMLIAIPKMFENNVKEYLTKQGYADFDILLPNVKANVVIETEKRRFVITGKSGDCFLLQNCFDRFVDYENMIIIKKIEKYFENVKNKVEMKTGEDVILISPAKDAKCKEVILTKNEVLNLYQFIKMLYQKDIYSYSAIKAIYASLEQFDTTTASTADLAKLEYNLLQLLKTNERKRVDLTIIGMSKNTGVICCQNTLFPKYKILWQSITGYYRKVLFEA